MKGGYGSRPDGLWPPGSEQLHPGASTRHGREQSRGPAPSASTASTSPPPRTRAPIMPSSLSVPHERPLTVRGDRSGLALAEGASLSTEHSHRRPPLLALSSA